MHEYGVASALLRQVERVARERGARAVTRVAVRVGGACGVDAGLLAQAFEICRGGTSCQAAALELTAVEPRWECGACGVAVDAGGRLRCPSCAAAARLVCGDELTLERVEMEVTDV